MSAPARVGRTVLIGGLLLIIGVVALVLAVYFLTWCVAIHHYCATLASPYYPDEYLVAVSGALLIAGVVIAVIWGPSAPVPAHTRTVAATPICSGCGKPTTYVALYGRYYCQTCARYV